MKLRTALAGAVLAAGLCSATASWAFPGYVTRSVGLRAGPDPSYPVVERVRAGSRIQTLGCLEGWGWCEVGVYGDRGWVPGNRIQALHHRHRVYVMQAGPEINIPVIRFDAGSYWDEHYRHKPFYRDRGRWMHDRDDHHGYDRDHDHDHDHDYDRDNRDRDDDRRDHWDRH